MDTYNPINYKQKDYIVFKMTFKGNNIPVILDLKDFNSIKKMNKKWRCNQNGFILCSHSHNGITKDVFLHELVMILKNKEEKKKDQTKSIIHINRLGLDNRRENLIYDMLNKDINKNSKKKKRTLSLPKNSDINPKEIPTYIWYMRPDYSHGERFVVNIGDITWKTTSTRDLSLRYKLEEAKIFLKNLLRERPDLLEEYSMNGDFNKKGKTLLNSYYDIIYLAGYNNIKRYVPENKTLEYLQPHYSNLDQNEFYVLKEKKYLMKNN